MKIVDQDLDCEKFIFNNADGIIHRYKRKYFWIIQKDIIENKIF